jgi:predicted ATPase
VEQVTGDKALPSEVVQQIVAKTDGVPLFVEELTKMVMESGLVREEDGRYVGAHGDTAIPLAIPATLQDSLMARLDRLSMAKEIAQLGATLGREFSYELLHAVSPVDEETLQQGLGQLVKAELIYQRGLPPQAVYFFKHALGQDTAYQSLLKSRRQQLHQQIAEVLEKRFTDITATQPELLAHHYTGAGLVMQALPYWQQAGERANEHSAYVEAVAYLTKGLELLRTLPDMPQCTQQELGLQLALGSALIVTHGYTAPQVATAYGRARVLCQQMGETPQLFPVLWGLWVFYFIRGELQTARALGEQLLSLAQRVHDPALLVGAHGALGETLYILGDFARAHAHAEQGIFLYTPQHHRALVPLYGQDLGVTCFSFAAIVLWLLGYPEQALERSKEGLQLAQTLSHPHTLAMMLSFSAVLHRYRREAQAVHERADALIALATEQGFPYWLAYGTVLRGWALAEQGQEEEGIAQMEPGLAAFRAMGTEVLRAVYQALLAEAYGKMGQGELGAALLAEALAVVDRTGTYVYAADLYRIKGELILQTLWVPGATFRDQHPESEARACFQRALDFARQQQAKSLELRAAMSLSRLWQQQGKRTEARRVLAEIYGWFTEGFDTKDLQEAKALLEELT